jgi:hypothetical protein
MLAYKNNELDLINQFMKGDKDTKAVLFDELVGISDSLLTQLKTALEKGTREERKQILKKLKTIQYFMQVQFEKIKRDAKLSNQDLSLIIERFISNSPSYRYKISNAKKGLETHKEGLKKFIKTRKPSSIKLKSKWIRS